jgi:hypothetical protein
MINSQLPPSLSVDQVIARIEQLPGKRYDLLPTTRCGQTFDEMEQHDDGDWIRYEDVGPIVNACLILLRQQQEPQQNEIDRLKEFARADATTIHRLCGEVSQLRIQLNVAQQQADHFEAKAHPLSPSAAVSPEPQTNDDPWMNLASILESAGATLRVGLRQQGKFDRVHEMYLAGESWEAIGKEIGWDGPTAERWYRAESQPLPSPPSGAEE